MSIREAGGDKQTWAGCMGGKKIRDRNFSGINTQL
jgi:hypothetical protein